MVQLIENTYFWAYAPSKIYQKDLPIVLAPLKLRTTVGIHGELSRRFHKIKIFRQLSQELKMRTNDIVQIHKIFRITDPFKLLLQRPPNELKNS
ncbi:MAG: hypothetical protein EZS28_013940 [Streblomastix strix]|uniref:Uncharacterized protein n=1 Tax=Streblomastix strix TaxID=222440 RepID=A0A5J4W741_9EUKA|nr:MAG: hypothetical protein EZS28_013940 [Streblomastix strix]